MTGRILISKFLTHNLGDGVRTISKCYNLPTCEKLFFQLKLYIITNLKFMWKLSVDHFTSCTWLWIFEKYCEVISGYAIFV
jgi:hypothetical protein